MFVIIIVAIIAFLLFTVVANCTFWVVSYWISSLCAAFANKDKKLVQGLSQTTILLVEQYSYSFIPTKDALI
jgi:uncharacterized protein YqfA (UPF0365 family)